MGDLSSELINVENNLSGSLINVENNLSGSLINVENNLSVQLESMNKKLDIVSSELQRVVTYVDKMTLLNSTYDAFAKMVDLYNIKDVVNVGQLVESFGLGNGSPKPFNINGSSNIIGQFFSSTGTDFKIDPKTGIITSTTPGFPLETWYVIDTIKKDGASYLFWYANNNGITALSTVQPVSGSRVQEIGIIQIIDTTLKMTGLKGYPYMTVSSSEEAFKINLSDVIRWIYDDVASETIFNGFTLGAETCALNKEFAIKLGLTVSPEPDFLTQVYNQVTTQNYNYAIWSGEQQLN